MKKRRVLGIIPARGGSKGIPKKNIRILGGRPLLAYTVEVAKKAEIFDRIILSTDCEEIAEVGKILGIEVPFLRPKELSNDETPTLPVIQHAVKFCLREGWCPDFICILQPTAPFRNIQDLVNGYQLIVSTECDSVVSIEEVPEHYLPHFVMRIQDGKLIHFLADGAKVTRRQDAVKAYTRSGCFYFTKANVLMSGNSIYGTDCRPIIVNNDYSVNLDAMDDWYKAERVAKLFTENKLF
jgi:CMP-N-acetylneuraminic acid synthetase